MKQTQPQSGTDVHARARLPFGYNQGLPATVDAAWGARWIITQSGVVDQAFDRQGAFGPYDGRKAIRDYLNEKGKRDLSPLDQAMAMAGQLLRDNSLHTDDDREVILYEDQALIIKGNPMLSRGHLFVCAYFKHAGVAE